MIGGFGKFMLWLGAANSERKLNQLKKQAERAEQEKIINQRTVLHGENISQADIDVAIKEAIAKLPPGADVTKIRITRTSTD